MPRNCTQVLRWKTPPKEATKDNVETTLKPLVCQSNVQHTKHYTTDQIWILNIAQNKQVTLNVCWQISHFIIFIVPWENGCLSSNVTRVVGQMCIANLILSFNIFQECILLSWVCTLKRSLINANLAANIFSKSKSYRCISDPTLVENHTHAKPVTSVFAQNRN